MATKTFYVTRDMKHPLYRGRMLTAGEPLELDAPTARLYRQLNAITNAKPKAPPKIDESLKSVVETVVTPNPKRAPRKRAAKKK